MSTTMCNHADLDFIPNCLVPFLLDHCHMDQCLYHIFGIEKKIHCHEHCFPHCCGGNHCHIDCSGGDDDDDVAKKRNMWDLDCLSMEAEEEKEVMEDPSHCMLCLHNWLLLLFVLLLPPHVKYIGLYPQWVAHTIVAVVVVAMLMVVVHVIVAVVVVGIAASSSPSMAHG